MSDLPTSREGGSTVLSLTAPLTRESARQLAKNVEDVARPVVIDLTDIPAFDTDGAAVLLDLQDRFGDDQVRIRGLGQAVARLLGLSATSTEGGPKTSPHTTLRVTRLHNIAVIRAELGVAVSGAALEEALGRALVVDASIIVVDLLGTIALTPGAVDALTFASSEAALRGRELLVVNAAASDAALLQRSGMSATTFVAPVELP